MPSTDRLLQFCAVVESGSLAAAAELLAITPGALSRAVQSLGQELGLQLFMQVGRNIVPTDEGRLVYQKAKRWLETYESDLREIRERKARPAALRLGSFEVFTSHVLPWLIAETGEEDETVLVRELVPGAMEQAVEEGEIDWALTYLPVTRPDVEHLKIATFRFETFVSPGPLERTALSAIPFAIPTTPLGPNPGGAGTLDLWPPGVPRTVRYHFELLETALSLAQRGKCALHAPEFVVRLFNERFGRERQLVPHPDGARLLRVPPQHIYLVKRPDMAETRRMKQFCSQLRGLCRQEARPRST